MKKPACWTVFLCLLYASISWTTQAETRPRNVILMIGDGMGLAQVTMARLSKGTSTALRMDAMKVAALVFTHSANSLITDSAAAGTALASGFKANNGMISVLPDGKVVETFLEAAQKRRKSVGLVTTTTITHATPASFGAHVSSRAGEADIAPQYLEKKIDVLLGGGRAFFLPKSAGGSKREDSRDLLQEARAAGYAVVDTREGMTAVRQGKLLGLFQMSYLTTEAPEPSLAEMTGKALELLSPDKDGFFLMVEGGQIDSRCHAQDAAGAIKQTLDFDVAIGKALEFARKDGRTLVIVTADHETGGLTLIAPEAGSKEKIRPNWGTKDHSGINVPLLADGPGAVQFQGVMDNTEIPRKLAVLWRLAGFAAR